MQITKEGKKCTNIGGQNFTCRNCECRFECYGDEFDIFLGKYETPAYKASGLFAQRKCPSCKDTVQATLSDRYYDELYGEGSSKERKTVDEHGRVLSKRVRK